MGVKLTSLPSLAYSYPLHFYLEDVLTAVVRELCKPVCRIASLPSFERR